MKESAGWRLLWVFKKVFITFKIGHYIFYLNLRSIENHGGNGKRDSNSELIHYRNQRDTIHSGGFRKEEVAIEKLMSLSLLHGS